MMVINRTHIVILVLCVLTIKEESLEHERRNFLHFMYCPGASYCMQVIVSKSVRQAIR